MRAINYGMVPEELMTTDIFNMISKLHEYRGRQDLFIEAKSDVLSSLLDLAVVQSTGASNRIEGIYTSEQRLEEIVLKNAKPHTRSEGEIAGYREVLSMIHESHDYIQPRPNIILQFHRDLYSFGIKESAGTWKNSDNQITEIDSDGNKHIRFQPATAFDTPQYIEQLCDQYIDGINKEVYDPLLLIPMFVLDFLCIHPFNDGNGRMSRLLTLLLMYRSGYKVGKYISIENIIEKSKETYYKVLLESSIGWHENENTYIPFVKYYLGIMLRAYQDFEERVYHLNSSQLTKAQRIEEIFNKKIGKITKKNISELCPDISLVTIERTLSKLVKEGHIEKVDSGRDTGYVKIYK